MFQYCKILLPRITVFNVLNIKLNPVYLVSFILISTNILKTNNAFVELVLSYNKCIYIQISNINEWTRTNFDKRRIARNVDIFVYDKQKGVTFDNESSMVHLQVLHEYLDEDIEDTSMTLYI